MPWPAAAGKLMKIDRYAAVITAYNRACLAVLAALASVRTSMAQQLIRSSISTQELRLRWRIKICGSAQRFWTRPLHTQKASKPFPAFWSSPRQQKMQTWCSLWDSVNQSPDDRTVKSVNENEHTCYKHNLRLLPCSVLDCRNTFEY